MAFEQQASEVKYACTVYNKALSSVLGIMRSVVCPNFLCFYFFFLVTVVSGLLMFLLFVSELSYYLSVDVSLF